MARIVSATPWGIDARSIGVEVDVDVAQREMRITGAPESAARECGLRVQAALRSSGYDLPPRRVTVRLEPLEWPKEAAHLDFPIALGLLSALGLLAQAALEGRWVYGELGLDGSVRPVRGSLAIADLASRRGVREILLPAACAGEAASLGRVRVIPVRTLVEAVRHLAELAPLTAYPVGARPAEAAGEGMPDLSEIRGQEAAKRALEVAAAGGHHLLLIGPPGSGKTLLARRLPGILAPLSREESIEVTKIHSLVAERPPTQLATQRPFRSPHSGVSSAGMSGGGKLLRPGEASLAHAGVLFLDELTEFRRDTLQVHALRSDLRLSERAVARILKVARTLADLDRSDSIRNPHLAEALTLARGWEVPS